VDTGEAVDLNRTIKSGEWRGTSILIRHLENYFQLDGRAERKARGTVDRAAWALVFAEDVLQKFGSGVGNFRLIANVSRCGDGYAEAHDPRHFVERPQMLARDGEDVERRESRRRTGRFQVELRAEAPDEFRRAAFCREHAGEKKQIACAHRFDISAERLGRRRKRDAEFFSAAARRLTIENFRGQPCALSNSDSVLARIQDVTRNHERRRGENLFRRRPMDRDLALIGGLERDGDRQDLFRGEVGILNGIPHVGRAHQYLVMAG
jgi:hypothetical protein